MQATTRIAAYVATLAAVFGASWAAGSAWGPAPEPQAHEARAHERTAQQGAHR